MAKHEEQRRRYRKRSPHSSYKGRVLWLVIALGLAGFAVFLLMITSAPQKTVLKAEPPPITSIKKPSPEKAKPKFEFYNILPEKQIAPNKNKAATESPAEDKKTPSIYWVQLGAFQQFDDADSLKAELAFLGFSAQIQTATINGQSWYRVRSGPFKTEADAKKAQKAFKESDIDSKIVY